MDKFLLTDTAGKKSVTVTSFVLGFIIVNMKLLFADATVGPLTFSEFSGSEYAMALSALGAIYVLRRATDKPKVEK